MTDVMCDSSVDTTIDPRQLRRALGCYATGVVVVTACDDNGVPWGITVNSFTSVSLEPPLIAWCLRQVSERAAAFTQCESYIVHILSAEQEALSVSFATDPEPFLNQEVHWHANGNPQLPGCCARFVVQNLHHSLAGDHLLFLGQVLEFSTTEYAPLLFHGGQYRRLERDK